MRGTGANLEDLYGGGLDSDSDGSNSEGGKCMFGKANAGYDTDDDWSSLDSDLYEPEDKEGDFEYRPLSKDQKAHGNEYNIARLDVEDDLSVGSDNEFIMTSKSNKKWDWVEADEQSVGSDDDFEVQFAGRNNGVYDLKGGQGEIEDFLGGGGAEDDNEDMAFHTDYATQQRTEAFLNEGSGGGVYRAGEGKGGELVETEYLPAKAGAARRRLVNPAFIAAQGTAKSRELVEQGLARARARSGRGRSVAEQQAEVEAGLAPRAGRPARLEKVSEVKAGADDEKLPLIPEKQARVEAQAVETQEQSKARVERSLAKIRSAMAGAKTEEAREAVEERVLSEIDGISEDMKAELQDAMKGSPTTAIVKKIKVIEGEMGKLDAKVKAGLSVAGMIVVAGRMLLLEARVRTLLKSKMVAEEDAEAESLISLFSSPTASAPPPEAPKRTVMVVKPQSRLAKLKAEVVASEAKAEPPRVQYQQNDSGRQVIEIAGIVVKPNGVVKSDVYGVDGVKIDKYSPLDVLQKNKDRVKAFPTKTPNRTKVMAQIQRFIDNHVPEGRLPKLPKGLRPPKAPKVGGGK